MLLFTKVLGISYRVGPINHFMDEKEVAVVVVSAATVDDVDAGDGGSSAPLIGKTRERRWSSWLQFGIQLQRIQEALG